MSIPKQVHLFPQCLTGQITLMCIQERGFKVGYALEFQSHFLAILSHDANFRIQWYTKDSFDAHVLAQPHTTLDEVMDTVLTPVRYGTAKSMRWMKEPTPHNPLYADPEDVQDFVTHVALWWLYQIYRLNKRQGGAATWSTPIWLWLRSPGFGGQSPFRGIGAYSCPEILFRAGMVGWKKGPDVC